MFDNTLITRLIEEKDPLKKVGLMNQFEMECQEMDRIRIEDMMSENS